MNNYIIRLNSLKHCFELVPKNLIFDIHSVKPQWITLFLQIAIIVVPLLFHRTFTCLNDCKLTCPLNIILLSRQRKMKTSVIYYSTNLRLRIQPCLVFQDLQVVSEPCTILLLFHQNCCCFCALITTLGLDSICAGELFWVTIALILLNARLFWASRLTACMSTWLIIVYHWLVIEVVAIYKLALPATIVLLIQKGYAIMYLYSCLRSGRHTWILFL